MPFQRINHKRHNAFKILKTLQEKMLIVENLKIRPEENIEDASNEEFSESDLLEIQDSPTFQSPDLKRKSVVAEGLTKKTSVDNIMKQTEEEKELIFNLEDDLVNKDRQKKENLAILIEPSRNNYNNNRRVSKMPIFKDRASLQKCGTSGTSDKETSWDQEFERIHIFTHYFCKNNVDLLLKNYDKFMLKKMARIQKLKNQKKKKTLLASILASSPQKFEASRFMQLSDKKIGILKSELSDENSPPINSPIKKDLSISGRLENKKR